MDVIVDSAENLDFLPHYICKIFKAPCVSVAEQDMATNHKHNCFSRRMLNMTGMMTEMPQ